MTPAAVKKTTAPPTEAPAKADAKQLARMHGLLAAHGINGDVTRHDWLTAAVGRPITSASELSKVECAHVIHDLEAEDVPEARTATAKQLRDLRAPFDDEAVGKLPRSTCNDCGEKGTAGHPGGRGTCPRHPTRATCRVCGNYHNTAGMIHLDFVGHADVTARLLEVDPLWTWEPAMCDPNGRPSVGASVDRDGNLWINLTVLGVTRPGVGDGKNAKEKIGDALRNAAMRFGVALDLWAKGDREWAHTEKTGSEDQHPDAQPPGQPEPEQPWTGPSSGQTITRLMEHAAAAGTDLDGITAKWREQHGAMSVDDLHLAPARDLYGLEQGIAAYLAAHPPLTGDADV